MDAENSPGGDAVRQFVDDLANVLIAVHDAVPPEEYDWVAGQLQNLSPNSIAVIALLMGAFPASLQKKVDAIVSADPSVKRILSGNATKQFAAFLKDAEQREILINLMGRFFV